MAKTRTLKALSWRQSALSGQAVLSLALRKCFHSTQQSYGVKAYGVHINGWSQTSQGPELWVARRSPTKQKWPGKLDHLAAGGQVSLTLAGQR